MCTAMKWNNGGKQEPSERMALSGGLNEEGDLRTLTKTHQTNDQVLVRTYSHTSSQQKWEKRTPLGLLTFLLFAVFLCVCVCVLAVSYPPPPPPKVEGAVAELT